MIFEVRFDNKKNFVFDLFVPDKSPTLSTLKNKSALV